MPNGARRVVKIGNSFPRLLVYKCKKRSSSAHNTLWKNFSLYIRLRDALAETGGLEYARCITCGKLLPISELEAGHMIPGRTNGILYDESIVYAQCRQCNGPGGGEKQKYKMIMIEKHGEAWYNLKEQARRTPTDLQDWVLREMNKEILKKIKKMRESV
jgi:hypothetical protein